MPTKGIRQGDPLSPYLFLICAEGFTSLLAKVKFKGRLHEVAVCRSAPSITNLLFADDSLIFCHANKNEVQVVSDTLQLYAETSGQCINLEKSSAYFISVDTHFRDTFRTSPIQPSSTFLWTRFMYYILFILLSMAQAHVTIWGKLRKCGLESMGWFLSDLLHEPSPCMLPSGQGTLVAPQAHGIGFVSKISTPK